MPDWFEKFLPILILLGVVILVISRLPRVPGISHSPEFRRRRVLNWLPLGLIYAFLYMGRYNLTVAKDAFGDALMDNADFGWIFGAGTFVYGFSFLLNGPLTDRYGGKFAILLGAGGAVIFNALMGIVTLLVTQSADPGQSFLGGNLTSIFALLYSGNMYFQSFGAVAIVKCNAPWFHVRERGVFGAIFGILISLGIYFAFDWGYMIIQSLPLAWVFFIPAILLIIFWFLVFSIVRNTPGDAGFADFDTKDASSGDDGPNLGAIAVFKMMLSNPVILTIASIEFCSGFLRQAIMQWYRTFAKQTGISEGFVYENWGMLLCAAGIMGGVFAGVISDHIFKSRRGPVAAALYALMFIGAVILTFTYQTSLLGPTIIFMSLCVIGVHGMLSGTASMDFGGRRNTGIAVGIIDGFVYAGTGVMAFTYAMILPKPGTAENNPASDPDNWIAWPITMIPIAVIGFFLATKIWNATPKPQKTPTTMAASTQTEGHTKP